MSEEIIQGTEAWFAARRGKVTASRVADVVAKIKTGAASRDRDRYRAQLVCERMTEKSQTIPTTQAMQDGKDREPAARKLHEVRQGVIVREVGFVDHPTISMAGCSPDGLIDPLKGLEVKCPQDAEHMRTLETGNLQERYVYQVQWCMACTGREAWDYVSYNPNWEAAGMDYFYKQIARCDTTIAHLEKEVRKFLEEVDNKVQAFRTQYNVKDTFTLALETINGLSETKSG